MNWRIDRQGLTATLEPAVPGLEHFVLPLEPMIGCFGVAPAMGQAFSTATSAENGGNMDYRGFGPGATVWFPVAVPGALFFLGDCHATQGDGEIVGTGIETCFEVEVRLTVEKGRNLVWPRGESATDIFSVGNARPLDQALQHATTDMFNWLTSDYGLSPTAASHLMGQVVRYDVGNVLRSGLHDGLPDREEVAAEAPEVMIARLLVACPRSQRLLTILKAAIGSKAICNQSQQLTQNGHSPVMLIRAASRSGALGFPH